jgi:poly(beta-D-mannuronate) lyase
LIVTGDEKYNVANSLDVNPEFKEGTYELSDKSGLKGKATNGSDLGVIIKN